MRNTNMHLFFMFTLKFLLTQQLKKYTTVEQKQKQKIHNSITKQKQKIHNSRTKQNPMFPLNVYFVFCIIKEIIQCLIKLNTKLILSAHICNCSFNQFKLKMYVLNKFNKN